MRLLELELTAFGAFTDTRIDLSGGSEGLHIVYGNNEAGKSTALAGLGYLLYGFPHQTSLDFIHNAKNLRIGGLVTNTAGDELHFVRRKGRKDTILSPGGASLGDGVLAPFLHGIDGNTFGRMFGLNHQGLVSGGQEILEGRGKVGESLFAAGLGTANLMKVQRHLEEQVAGLFLTRGQKPKINKAVGDYDTARKRIKEFLLSNQDWADLKKQLDDAEAELGRFQEDLAHNRREQTRLGRVQRLVPMVGALKKVKADLANLGEVSVLPISFAEDRRDVQRKIADSQSFSLTAQTEITRLEKELGKLELPDLLIAAKGEIVQLHEDLGEYRKNGRDLPHRQGEQHEKDGEAKGILREIRPDLSLDHVEALRLSPSQKSRIRKQIKDHHALHGRMGSLDATIQEAEAEIDEARVQLDELPVQRDPAELLRVLKQSTRLGDIEALRAEHETKSTGDNRAYTDLLNRLQGWVGPIQDLRSTAFPSTETVERFQNEIGGPTDTVAQTGNKIDETRRQLKDTESKLRRLQSSGSVPLEEDLALSRDHRDCGWHLVRRSWEGKAVKKSELEGYEPGLPLADAYEKSVGQADDVSDRLRHEAERVTQIANLNTAIEEHRIEIGALDERLSGEEEALAAAKLEWKGLWAGVGVEPGTPAEMMPWLQRVSSIIEHADARDAHARTSVQLAEKIEAARTAIGACLIALGEPEPEEAESLETLLDRSDQLSEAIRGVEQERTDLQKDIRRLSATVTRKKEEAGEARKEFKQWKATWEKDLCDFGLDKVLPPAETEDALERLDRLFRLVDESAQLKTRIDGMSAEMGGFEVRVKEIAGRLALELGDMPEELEPDQIVQWLNGRLERAGQEAERRASLTESLEKEQAKLREHTDAEQTSLQALVVLCEQAGCTDPGDLPELERLSEEYLKLTGDRDTFLNRIAEASGGLAPEAGIEEVEEIDPDELPAKIKGIEDQIEELETKRKVLTEEKGAFTERLKALEKERPATEAAEEAESALARVREAVFQYMPVRLAQVLLQREIDEYRERHQGPLVQRASDIFEALTVKSFERLATDYLEDDTAVLVGIRPSGARVGVEAMSDGTRDQLYLALRLASLEMHLTGNEPIPLAVDDIMINFDDERASAGLEVLGAFSERTQVILFTHHRRIVELAEACVPEKTLFVTELKL